jgi:predicted phage tail protein
VRVVVTVPALISQDTDSGDTHGADVWVRFEVATNGGGYASLGDFNISGKARSRYQRAYQFNLPKFGGAARTWNIKMTRLTDDSTTSALQNETYFDSYYAIVNARLSYPNSVLIGVQIDSSQFNSIPERSYLIDGLFIKVPSNYSPVTRTYSGVWNGTFKTAVSGNPAWVLYDVLTSSRYGLGQYLNAANVDSSKLYAIGKYCDELVPDGFGGMEPRFTINTSINSLVEAYRLITDLCSAFNGMGFWAGGMVNFTQDAPADPVMVYNQANVVDGLFQYAGSSRKDRHSVVLVRWNDPTQNYKQMVEYVEDSVAVARYGVRKLDTTAFGCTSRGQAARVGRWILYTEQYQSDMVQFVVGVDSALVLPGDVIKIHDTTRAGKRMGGRLVASTLTSATLDAPIAIGTGATISIRLPDGSFADRPLIQSGVTVTDVSWTTPLPAQPVPYAVWIASDSDVTPLLARVVGVAQGDPGQFAISAIEHNPSKYGAIENGLKLDVPKVSIVTTAASAAATNLAFHEVPYLVAPGVAGISLDVSWSGTGNSYELTWKRSGKYATNWQTITTTNPIVELQNVRAGDYEFNVVALNGFGKRSPVLSGTYATTGHTAAPGDVPNFQVTRRTSDLLLTWDAVSDIKVSGYEVRVGASWDAGEVITTNFAGTMITHDQDFAGTYNYHIRSISADGVYSDNVSTFVLTLEAPATVQNFDMVQASNRLELSWSANTETNLAYYEVREGSAWSTGAIISQVKSTALTIPSGGIGSRKFWIKAVVSPGIYSDVPAWIDTVIALPSNANVVALIDNAALAWPGPKVAMSAIGSDLVMNANTERSEYLSFVNLSSTYRAQNSVYVTIDSVQAGSSAITWNTATFSWDSVSALAHWAPSGNIDSISTHYQIAIKGGLNANEYQAWSLSGDVASVTGLRAANSGTGVSGNNGTLSVTYANNGRFGSGVVTDQSGDVYWSGMTLPAQFTHSFWMTQGVMTSNTKRSILSMTNDALTVKLALSYSEANASFLLTGTDGVTITVPMAIAQGDLLCFAIVQSASRRTLFVGRYQDGLKASGSAAAAPLDALTRVALAGS